MKLNSFIIRILDRFGTLEKVSDGGLVCQDSVQYSKSYERCFSMLTVVLDDGYEAVCDNCNIYLYSHSVLAGSLKGKIRICCFIHLKKSSTCHLCLQSIAISLALIVKSFVRNVNGLVIISLWARLIIWYANSSSVGVSIREIAQLYVSATETEMVTLTLYGINDCRHFSKTVTVRELSEHHDKMLIPIGEIFLPLITLVSFYNAIKDSFSKKTGELTEYVFACINIYLVLVQYVKLQK